MVEAARPVSESVVPVNPLAIWFDVDGVNPAEVDRKTEYVTPLVVDAVQLRLIWLEETAVALRLVGATGALAVQLTVPGKTWNSESCAAVHPVLAVKTNCRYCSVVPDGRLKLTVFPVVGLKV